MADTENKVIKIDVVADAKSFRDAMKKSASEANTFDKGIKSLKKAGVKDDKNLQKISKDFAKWNKTDGQAAIKQEKQLLSAMKEKAKVMNQLFAAGKNDSKTFKANRKELAETAEAYADIKKQRIEMIGLTRREKAAKTGGGIGSSLITAGKLGILGLLGGAVGAVTSRVSSSADAAAQHRAGLMSLSGDRDAQYSYKGWRSQGLEMGYDPNETVQQASQLSRGTGFGGNVGNAQQFARAGMLDMNQSAGFFGSMAKGHKGLADGLGNPVRQTRELTKIMTSAFSTGLEKGRFGEFLEGVTSLNEGAGSRVAGNTSPGDYASLLAAIGSSGKAGMTGARGAAVLSQLENGVMKPGGGDAGQALVMRSKGFGSPGGNTSFYDATKRQQRGFTGEKGADELAAFINQTKKEYGGNTEAARMATSNMTGLSLDVVEEVFKAVAEMGGSEKLTEKIAKLTEEGESLEQQALNVMKTDLATQTIRQSALQEALVLQGEDVVGSTQKMADLLNDAMNRVWPAVAKSLEFIADVLSDTYNFWKDSPLLNAMGGDSAKSARSDQKREFETFIRKGEAGLIPNYMDTLKKNRTAFGKSMLETNGDKDVDLHEEKIMEMYNGAIGKELEKDAARVANKQAKAAAASPLMGVDMNAKPTVLADESIDKLATILEKRKNTPANNKPVVVPAASTYTGR